MKSIIIIATIFFSISATAQKANKEITYHGNIGLTKVEFKHAPFPLGSTATLSNAGNTETFSNCAEDPNAKFQKLCFFNDKDGFNNKKYIIVKIPAHSKNPPKIIEATYTVNGIPARFKLRRM